MKKVFLAFALCFSSVGFAQLLDVKSVVPVNIPAEMGTGSTIISPAGDYLLLTDAGKTGLQKYDLSTGKISTITSAPGAGYDVKILEDGKTIVYRETSFKGNLRNTTLKSKNLSTGSVSTVVDQTRDLQGVTVKDGSVYTVKNGKLSKKGFNGVKTSDVPVMSIKNGQLMMTSGGKTKVFSPNGTKVRYIWPSVSPDGKKVLYYVTGVGAYICNLDGSGVTPLGIVRAPKWYDNNTVIGMNNESGEYTIVKSDIVAVSADGQTRQTLTDGSVIAMYPSATAKGDKISFTTDNGGVYIINVNVKK